MTMRRMQTMAFMLLPLAPSDVLLRATGFVSPSPTARTLFPTKPQRDASSTTCSSRRGQLRSGVRSRTGATAGAHGCDAALRSASRSRAAATIAPRGTRPMSPAQSRRGSTRRMLPACCASAGASVDESPSPRSSVDRLHGGSTGWSARVPIGQGQTSSVTSGGGAVAVTKNEGCREELADATPTEEAGASAAQASRSRRDVGRENPAGFRDDLEVLPDPATDVAGVREGHSVALTKSVVNLGEGDWDSEADGVPWTEFEDWLLQDTFSRYVIGSGKHVLWRRMVKEVPELMGRTPQEARQRWLRLTGRSRESQGDGGRDHIPGSPSIVKFYLQPPVLEQWEEVFEGQDGAAGSFHSFRGNVFGQRGLADGTVMTTAPVDASGRRIQDQYVSTQCGVVYELGEGLRTDVMRKTSSKILKLAPATVLALSAAFYALTALSHHIQVEVFVI